MTAGGGVVGGPSGNVVVGVGGEIVLVVVGVVLVTMVVDAGVVVLEAFVVTAAGVDLVVTVSGEDVPAQATTAKIVSRAQICAKERLKLIHRISAALAVPWRPGCHAWSTTKGTRLLFASAVPIEPGQTDRYRGLARELEPHLDEYAELNRSFEVARHSLWINHGQKGDLGVSVYDISSEGLARMRRRRWEDTSSYDTWWLGFVEDVNGIDMRQTPAHRAPPELVFSWEVDEAAR
jgi:hypothetical protein